MGGCCCCASRGTEHNNPPPLYQSPRSLEGGLPLSFNNGSVSVVSPVLIVNTNLSTQTNTPPQAPVPYDNFLTDANSGRITQEATIEDTKSGLNALSDIELCIVNEVVDVLDKCGDVKKPCESFFMVEEEEEDVCPTCLEEYDIENPKIITKCQHYFHLACILEWMERSDTCPVCNKEMVFSTCNES